MPTAEELWKSYRHHEQNCLGKMATIRDVKAAIITMERALSLLEANWEVEARKLPGMRAAAFRADFPELPWKDVLGGI